MKYFIIGATSIVGIVIGIAFFVVGSPFSARQQQFDESRIYDLQNIQSQIINFWQTKERLPDTLSELDDPLSGFRVPRDPEKAIDYEYEKRGDVQFALCAMFATETKTSQGKGIYAPVAPIERIPTPAPVGIKGYDTEWNWTHPAGRFCFERTIDTERYKLFDKKY